MNFSEHPSSEQTLVFCDSRYGLHPVTWLLGCCCFVLFLPWLSWSIQAFFLLVTIFFLALFRASEFIRLCYKSRFLLIITTILLAWQTPGKTIFPTETLWLITWLPTQEGLLLAVKQLGTLLLYIALISLCLNLLNKEQWMIGIYRIACWIPGVCAKRFSVQLTLTLNLLVSLPPITLKNFEALFNPQTALAETPQTQGFLLSEPPIRWIDGVVLILLIVFLISLWKIT